MPTPFESAQLILKLYELRREETMRKARDFFIGFDPATFDEYVEGLMGPNSAYIRMVTTYWDMAASFVTNGAIDSKMFYESAGEFVIVFARTEPFLPQLREMFGNPQFAANLEKVALGMPNAREVIDGTLQRMRRLVAARRAALAGANNG
jgi:hypothetical protein